MLKLRTSLACLALIATGCGSASTPSKTPALHATRTAAVKTPGAFLPSLCTNQVQHPDSFLIACADGGSGLEHIVWHAWGSSIVEGSGSAFVNDCEPSCVAGGVHHSAAEIYVRRLRHCGRRLQYTYAVIVASEASIAGRVTGAYAIPCATLKSAGVSRTQPEYEEAHLADGPPLSDQEVRHELQLMREARKRHWERGSS